MADTPTSTTQSRPAAPAAPVTTMSILAPALAWLIPGAGHFIQKRWIRGALLMISVVAMFWLGLAMKGKVYQQNAGDCWRFWPLSATLAQEAFIFSAASWIWA